MAVEDEYWKSVSLCVYMLPSYMYLLFLALSICLVLALWLYRWGKMRASAALEEVDDEADDDPGSLVSSTEGERRGGSIAKAGASPPEARHAHNVKIPRMVGGSETWSHFTIELVAQVKNEKGRGRFTVQHCKVHIQAHSR